MIHSPAAHPPEDNQQEVILIVMVGLSPAVLTETIYTLATGEDPVIPDRILAVTTAEGRTRLQKTLFAQKNWEQFVRDLELLTGRSMRGALRFGPADDCIRVIPSHDRSHSLSDIRSQKDNDAVAEYLMETLRAFTEDEGCRIITSIAGGRKTSGALLLSVMSLIGRADDIITHVLVSSPWERIPEFLYPGCPGSFTHPDTGEPLQSESALLELAAVPFVPLRYLFKRDLDQAAGSYLKLINRVRSRAISSNLKVAITLDCRNGCLKVNSTTVNLSPREFSLYHIFALHAIEDDRPLSSINDILGDSSCDPLETNAEQFQPDDDPSHWSFRVKGSGTTDEDLRKLLSSIRQKLRNQGVENTLVDQIVPRRGHPYIQLPPDNIQILP